VTIKTHIINYLTFLNQVGIEEFKTSDIQNLSERSVKFAKGSGRRRLGSPSTYERTFRQLRQDNKIIIERKRGIRNEAEATWIIKEIK
jgi:hypothetical protein|tara:strand:+ start:6378 stop:6641 length:264 start_codon:yes stop_codon:yes gene_type:complete